LNNHHLGRQNRNLQSPRWAWDVFEALVAELGRRRQKGESVFVMPNNLSEIMVKLKQEC
jgi:hypothetical protein